MKKRPLRQGNEGQIEGRRPVQEALMAEAPVEKVWLQKGAGQLNALAGQARELGARVEWVAKELLDQKSVSRNHQGVIAWLGSRKTVEIERLLEKAGQRGEAPFLVVAAEIQDPHNLGSLIRSAEAAGAHGLILPERRSSGLTAAVAKASAGAIEHLPISRVKNLSRTLEKLKEEGLWIIGSSPEGERLYTEADWTSPVAVVVGNEAKGIPRLVREHCDLLVRLPMRGKVGSLNAGVAGAILFYEVVRQRTGGN